MKNIKFLIEQTPSIVEWAGIDGLEDYPNEGEYTYFPEIIKKSNEEIIGIEALICDLAMYREDINNSPGRFQRVVDELIKMLDTPTSTKRKLNHV